MHHISLLEASDLLCTPDGTQFVEVFARGSLTVELYQPVLIDRQIPHARDELYLVVRGNGTYRCAGDQLHFEAGDLLFAAAGVEHRFEAFSEDLTVWVVFYGVDGGERPNTRRVLGRSVSESSQHGGETGHHTGPAVESS